MEQAEQRVGGLGLAAILSLALVQMSYTAVTPAMATYTQHFPGLDVSWISTLPNLFLVLGTFAAGALMGKRLRFRTLALAGSLLAAVAGVAPFFLDDYAAILVTRGLYGLGEGLIFPLGNALILGLYRGQRQAQVLGWSTLCMNAGGIVMQLAAGWLAAIGWNVSFLAHAFIVIAFALAFFLPEPNAAEAPAQGEDAPKMAPRVYLLGLLLLVYNMVNFSMMMNMSTILLDRALGGPEVASVVLALFTVAGMVAGAVFGWLFARTARFVFTIGWGVSALGALAILLGGHLAVVALGTCLVGFGFSVVLPATLAWVGAITPAATLAGATSAVMALMSLGAFLGSFWLAGLAAAFGESVYSAVGVEAALFAAIAVVFAFASPFRGSKKVRNA